MISLLLALALVTQAATPDPGTPAADPHAEDIRCAGVLSTAQGLLRSEDTRRPAVATALQRVSDRINARVVAGEADEVETILALQQASNAAASGYEPQIESCLSVASGPAST